MVDLGPQKPELLDGLEAYYRAFEQLTSCRNVGLDEGPIPWTAIRDYANEHRIVGDMRSDLFHHVRALDNEYLRKRGEDRKQAQADGDKNHRRRQVKRGKRVTRRG